MTRLAGGAVEYSNTKPKKNINSTSSIICASPNAMHCGTCFMMCALSVRQTEMQPNESISWHRNSMSSPASPAPEDVNQAQGPRDVFVFLCFFT